MIEYSKNIAETSTTCSTFLDDYVQQVRQEKEKLSIPLLVKHVSYTEYYFSHKFKNETGYSVSDYIRHEKIQQAKILLSGTTMSIQEISNELSFNSRSYFSSFFQKETGLSPRKNREQNIKR